MSGITDIFAAGSDKAGPAPTQYHTWQPNYTGQMDNNFNSVIGNNLTAQNNAAPYWLSYLNNVTNNPYAQQSQNAANTAGMDYTNVGNAALENAGKINGASSTILNTAFDPMSSIYNTQHQNNSDTTNASLAARGLNSSAAGANIANQSDINFDQSWDANKLARQGAGMGAAAGGFDSANRLGLSGAAGVNAGGQLPYSTFVNNNNTMAQGLGTYGTGSTATGNQAISPMLQYLGLGAGQSNAQGNFDQQYWQNQTAHQANENDINDQWWSSLGNLGGNVGNSQMGASSPAWLSALMA